MHDRLERLRRKLALTTDPDDHADLEAAIAALEAKLASPPPTGDPITAGDLCHVTDAAPGAGAQSTVHNAGTGGGDYAEGNIDKRSGTFVAGHQYNLTFFFTAAGIADPSAAQQELVRAYLHRLAQRCDRLRLAGVVRRERRDATPPLTLSQVYVTLAADAWVPVRTAMHRDDLANDLAAGDPDVVLPEAARRVVELTHDGELSKAGRQRGDRVRLERPLLLTKAICEWRRKCLVLLGGPGSGKSTFLRYLALALARGTPDLPGWTGGTPLPLMASLGAFAAWAQQPGGALDGPGLWCYLLTTAQEYGLDGLDQPLTQAFHQGGLLVLLDGLDEVADPGVRVAVARAVAALAAAGGPILATCRMRSFTGAVAQALNDWGVPCTLAPFTLGQMRHFVAAWYARSADAGAIDPHEATQRVAELTDRLVQLPSLRDLGQTPLLLTIMTILHYYEGKLPEDRADLYEDLVQLLLTRWTQQRRDAGTPPTLIDILKADGRLGGLKEYHLRQTLEELAYHAHQMTPAGDGRGLLDRHRVRGAFQDLFAAFEIGEGPAAEKAAQVLMHLEQESGLLLMEGSDLERGEVYGLPHLGYEEYLAGCFLSRRADLHARAYRHWQADAGRWREVIFLALGRMVRGEGRETAAGWLRFLLDATHGARKRDAAERQRTAVFAYECLDQMGGRAALIGVQTVDLPQLWANLAAGLSQVVEGTVLPAAERVQAGVWLGNLGDPRPGVCDLPPAMVEFVGGSFMIGNTPAEYEHILTVGQQSEAIHNIRTWYQDSINQHPVHVAPFALACYLITNAQYASFIAADGYNPEKDWWDVPGRRWLRTTRAQAPQYWQDSRFGIAHPNHPVVGISWHEAMAFCRWLTDYLNDGSLYVLPSEAEWEYTARGVVRRTYPWGNVAPDAEYTNYDQIYRGTSAVGCFPKGATVEGLLDMAGNVWEWTRSIYTIYPDKPQEEIAHTSTIAQKSFTIRGGAWNTAAIELYASNRNYDAPGQRTHDISFRIARHPDRRH